MIKNEKELLLAKDKLKENLLYIDHQIFLMKSKGVSDKLIKLATDPLRCLSRKLQEEIKEYESKKS